MGTNSTGCTEWERDFDPITEQPYRALSNDELTTAAEAALAEADSPRRPETNAQRLAEWHRIMDEIDRRMRAACGLLEERRRDPPH
jgi:hypothetical protein